jgi:hypothetical protein
VAAPIAAADPPVEAPPVPAPRRRRWWLAGLVACAVVVLGAYPSLPPGVRNWDNQVKLQVARNILGGRGPVLTEEPPDPGYLMPGRDGRNYTGYPPVAYVLQFATIGAAALGTVVKEGLPALLLLGLTAWALMAWGRRAGASMGAAAAGAMLVCFGTALWPMAAHGYDNQIEVLGLVLVLWSGTGPEAPRSWLWVGLAVGMAVATRFGAMGLAVPAAVLILAQEPRSVRGVLRRGLAFALGCAPGLLLALGFNHLRFGSPFVVDPRKGELTFEQFFVPWFSSLHWEAMAGLTVSPGKGLLWYAPPLIGVALLAVPLFRRHRVAGLALVAYALFTVVTLARLKTWHGEWGWGPRYLSPLSVAAAPLCWLLWERLVVPRGPARLGAALAFLLLAGIQAVPVVGYPIETYFSYTLKPLAEAGLLVTSPITRPPLPADNDLLYFRVETSPIVRLASIFPELLADPVRGPRMRATLAWAALAPLLALAFVAVAAWRTVRSARPAGRR